MTYFDSGRTLAERFRNHAGDREHLYGYAMRGMADDWEAGGAVRRVCQGYEDAPSGAAVQLRLLAGVFRLVLTGRARELVPFYPSLGGTEAPAQAWPVMQRVIGEHVDELHGALATAPQTNEVGRCAALLAGLFDLVTVTGSRQVRLLEVGASAGLNLLVDGYAYAGPGWSWGPAASPVRLEDAITGPVAPVALEVVERRGCDLSPVDATTEEGRLLLTSFVWPFDLARHRRLAGALEVAARTPPVVDRGSAGEWLAGQLALAAGDDQEVLTVVWQSITQLYWPPEEVERMQSVLAGYGAAHRVAHVSMEYAPDAPKASKPEVRTTLWQPGPGPATGVPAAVRRRLVGTAHDHGIPVRLGPG